MNKILYKIQYLKDERENHRNYRRAKALAKKRTQILNEIESGVRPRSDIELYNHYNRALSRIIDEMDKHTIKYCKPSEF